MMTEKHAYKSTGYIKKSLLNYWKKWTVISVVKYFVLSACVVFSDCSFLQQCNKLSMFTLYIYGHIIMDLSHLFRISDITGTQNCTN
jgi:hypothetical protein